MKVKIESDKVWKIPKNKNSKFQSLYQGENWNLEFEIFNFKSWNLEFKKIGFF